MTTIALDGETRARLGARFGATAQTWCDQLPDLVNRMAGAWQLEITGRYPAGGTSVVFHARTATGVAAALKLTPEPSIAAEESIALSAWARSAHVVDLIAADPAAGALLLAALEPGTPLRARDWSVRDIAPVLDDLASVDATLVAGLSSLERRVEVVFGLFEQRLDGWDSDGAVIDRRLVRRSRRAAIGLAGSGPMGLVHGDLHPGNVLRTTAGRLVAIDPRPSVGDPAFDAVDWVLTGCDSERAIDARICELAGSTRAGDSHRIAAWSAGLAVVIAAATLRRDPADRGGRFLCAWADTILD